MVSDVAVDVVGRVSDQFIFFSPKKAAIQLLDIDTLAEIGKVKDVNATKMSLRCYVENKFAVILGFGDTLVSFEKHKHFNVKNKAPT